MKTLLYNAELVFPERVAHGWLLTDGDRIAAVETGEPPEGLACERKLDLGGDYLAPGFVELHSHGAGGSDFMDGRADTYQNACQTHLEHGTTTLLPTALAASREEILRAIDSFRAAKEALAGRSLNLHGLHMEGPYLNPAQKGAIDEKYIRNPQPEEYEEFLRYGKGAIARWTIAVELDGALRFADRLCEEGILPSVGHSNAEYAQVLEALHHGVTHVTHLYSAMSSVTRVGGFRHSGVLESAFCLPNLTVEMIADGCHLPPELLAMIWRLKGVEHTALTCDSMRCAGQDVKESILGSLENGQRVIIEDEVAKMPDRQAFAGSIATDDRLVRVVWKKAGVPLADTVRMMTLTPAAIIGLDKRCGSIAVGKDADLVCFDSDVTVRGVMVGGRGLAGMLKE